MIYRHFHIAAEQIVRAPPNLQGKWRARWRELPDGRWNESSVIDDSEDQAIDGAKRIVDYQYRIEVWEFVNGRKYHPITDGPIPDFDEPS